MCPIYPDEWALISPRLRTFAQVTRLPARSPPNAMFTMGVSSYSRGPIEFLFQNNSSCNAWANLARPAVSKESRYPRLLPANYNRLIPFSKLEELPTELLDMVFESLANEKIDVIALGLSSETLWSHALRHIERDSSRSMAPFAGTEIVVLGSNHHDLPDSFNDKNLAISSVSPKVKKTMVGWFPEPFYDSATSQYEKIDGGTQSIWMNAWNNQTWSRLFIPLHKGKILETELFAKCSPRRNSSLDAVWILRNLTTKQYIRCIPSSSQTETAAYLDHPNAGKLLVDDILMMKICWSRWKGFDDEDCVYRGVYRGVWAGHCFDIVEFDPDKLKAEDQGWNDCTDMIMEDFHELYERIFYRRQLEESFPPRTTKTREQKIEQFLAAMLRSPPSPNDICHWSAG